MPAKEAIHYSDPETFCFYRQMKHFAIQNLTSVYTVHEQLTSQRPLLYQGAVWTVVLILTVAVASFSPELAFVSAISLSSPFSRTCYLHGYVRVPLDMPGEKICLPAHLVKRSSLDVFIPTLFAALIVASSALMLRTLGFSQH